MALDPITAGLDLAQTIVKSIWPDKSAQEQQQIAGALVALQGQLDANKIEAANPSLFIAGWRPAAGWVCVVALALMYWPKALVITGIWVYQVVTMIHGATDLSHLQAPAFPDLGVTDLIGLLGSLLGIGGLRTFDKLNGIDTKKVN